MASTRRRLRVAGRWYYLVTIGTAGLFAWVPFLHAALRLHTAQARRLTPLYFGLDAVLYLLMAVTPRNGQGNATGAANVASTAGGLLALGVIIVGCIQQAAVRRQVYEGLPADSGDDRSSAVQPAVSAALAARARRVDARRMAETDPLLARELHVGRPDMSRAYDDGGLVDLNSAPAYVIAEVCGIPVEVAVGIVDARTARDCPFANVDEIFVVTELPVSSWDRIRYRAVLIP